MTKGVRLVIKENIPQPLEEILRKYKVYTKYIEYTYYNITGFANATLKTKRMNTKTYQKFVRQLAKNYSDIAKAFNWSNSPEGFKFWENIYDEYIEKLEQLR